MAKKFFLSLFFCLLAIGILFLAVRREFGSDRQFPLNVESMNSYSDSNQWYHGSRETRTIDLNNNWESKVKDPSSITSVFVGTSRTKYLRPYTFFDKSSLVIGGNSYNEIAYGLLVEAEVAKRRFPNAKLFYFESSLLLRRAKSLTVEKDHVRYLDLFQQIAPLITDQYSEDEVMRFMKAKEGSISPFSWIWIKESGVFRLSNVLLKSEKGPAFEKFVRGEIGSLNEYGEYPSPDNVTMETSQILTALKEESPKVQRIVGAQDRIPGDRLFEVILKWGRQNKIQIVFYEPPVRSDLLRHKISFGLQKHKDDIRALVEKYSGYYIDLNNQDNGLSERWEFFSDEDHLNTCAGSYIYTKAVLAAYNTMESTEQRYLKWSFIDDIREKIWEKRCKLQ